LFCPIVNGGRPEKGKLQKSFKKTDLFENVVGFSFYSGTFCDAPEEGKENI
jgi:hypothetical protein